jgi:AraC-like DNA-binding protein
MWLIYHPQALLEPFVNAFWFYQNPRVPQRKEHRLPDGLTHLIFNLHDDHLRVHEGGVLHTFSGALITGMHSRYAVIDTADQDSVMGLSFKAGGVSALLHVPAEEVRDTHLALENIWGEEATFFRERLLKAPTPQARFMLLEHVLMQRLRTAPSLHPSVPFAVTALSTPTTHPSVTKLADTVGLSSRHFRQVFAEAVGLSPKGFARVQRFQTALRRLAQCQNVDGAQLALDLGYFDQAHFAHDFREFAGVSPSDYHARVESYSNHIPLL